MVLNAVCCALSNPAAAGTRAVESSPGPHWTAAATCAVMRQVEAFPARRHHKKLQRESPPGIFVPVRGGLTHTLETSDTPPRFVEAEMARSGQQAQDSPARPHGRTPGAHTGAASHAPMGKPQANLRHAPRAALLLNSEVICAVS